MRIHPSAIISGSAHLGANVRVGPFVVIEDDVTIGDESEIASHAVIHQYTSLGEGCQVGVGAVLGGVPQDRKFAGERSYLRIGSENTIREYVTLHRATGEENATVLGDRNFVMAYAHAGHNVTIGNDCLVSNSVGISGHVTLEDKVLIGGIAGVHQFVTISTMTMLSAMSGAGRDLPPFTICEGIPAHPRGINIVGLKRNGVTDESISLLRKAFRMLYLSGLNISEGIARADEELQPAPALTQFLDFHRSRNDAKRGRQMQP
jgi:UDP-N-acetylglucosamine acyltransferase